MVLIPPSRLREALWRSEVKGVFPASGRGMLGLKYYLVPVPKLTVLSLYLVIRFLS